MAKGTPKPSARSSNPRSTRELAGQPAGAQRRPPRAHRDDTFEAAHQRARQPKTHPGTRSRTPGAIRKDKGTGAAKGRRG
jgi:hypothetical protein